MFVGAGILLGWYLAPEREPGMPAAPEPSPVPETNPSGPIELGLRDEPAPDVRAGSLEETLLTTSEGNRDQLILRTIRDRGFDCPAMSGSDPIGDDGSAWRANCGDGLIYRVDIDELGRLSVAPTPYGDIERPAVAPRIQGEGRTLELQER